MTDCGDKLQSGVSRYGDTTGSQNVVATSPLSINDHSTA